MALVALLYLTAFILAWVWHWCDPSLLPFYFPRMALCIVFLSLTRSGTLSCRSMMTALFLFAITMCFITIFLEEGSGTSSFFRS